MSDFHARFANIKCDDNEPIRLELSSITSGYRQGHRAALCAVVEIVNEVDATIAAKDAEIARLRDALAPFAEIADHFPKRREYGNRPTEGTIYAWHSSGFPDAEMTVEHVHAARAALAGGGA